MSRFIVSEEIDLEKTTLFSIMDGVKMSIRPLYDRFRYAEAFGLSFDEGGISFLQLFGYKGATIGEMVSSPGIDVGGYYFNCFKTKPFPNRKFLIGNDEGLSNDTREIIGWGFHTSRYFPCAVEEAMFNAYRECRREGRQIARETKRDFVEIMHKETDFLLKSEEKDYSETKLEGGPFIPIYLGRRKFN